MLGQRLHNFAIMRLLGEGGMSSVYEAEHTLIRRKVAVKVLKSELSADGTQVQRFFNEARATSAIRHPNIVEVIDVGRLADGVPYLVMELLEGESLGERLDRVGSLEIPVALDYTRQAASALVAAHALRIVHRDLKPDNVFIVPDQRIADGELVKVLDFGIAKLRGDLAAPPFDTMVGAVLGTPPYMSPEQCRGLPEEIDERTDVYALGVILYEMLCGRPPFVADGAGELMLMHMTEPPEPPSRLNPNISSELEQLVLRMLAKRREDRFATMSELETALTELSIALGVVEPYVMRRSVPAAVGGGTSSGQSLRAPASFESRSVSHPPRGDHERERAVTRALFRRAPVDVDDPGSSGVVALGLHDHAEPQQRDDDDRHISAVLEASAGFDEELPTSQVVEVEVELPEDTGRSTAPRTAPPQAGGRPRFRAWFPAALVAVCLAVAVGFGIMSVLRRSADRSETSLAAASRAVPPSAELANPPMSAPEPQVSVASSGNAQPMAAQPPGLTAPAERIREPSSPAPAARAPASTRDKARDEGPPPKQPPTAAARKLTPVAAPASAAKLAPAREKSASPREAGEAPKLKRGAEPRPSVALTMRDFENETPAPEAVSGTPRVAAPRGSASGGVQRPELGYLSLDSAPRSDVFLGPDRLGTTPLMRVPLPPGKYLLTLRNPELGVSKPYLVEIQAGKTLSRLVGWDDR